MDASSIIGSAGVSLLLLAFVLNITNKLNSEATAYLVLNVLGALLAGISSYLISFWPFVILEGVWMFASLVPLIKKLVK